MRVQPFARRLRVLSFAGALAPLAPACTSDHGALAASDTAGTTATGTGTTTASTSGTTSTTEEGGGGSGPGGAGPGGSGSGGEVATGGGSGTGGAGGKDAGPAEPTELTLVNGVADHPAVRMCFLGYPDGDNAESEPWPVEPGGLPFARGRVVEPADVVPPGTDVRLHVFAGNLAAIAGKTCGEALAMAGEQGGEGEEDAGPKLVGMALAVLPASAFTSGKSLLLVPNGCLGGPGHTHVSEKLACGNAYAADKPTTDLVALGMSRQKAPANLSLQVVHAVAPLVTSDFRITPGFEAAPDWQVAPALSFGAVGPSPPFADLAAAGFGSFDQLAVKTFVPGDSYPTSAVVLKDVLAESDVKPAQLVDGASVTLIAVGAHPGAPSGAFWHPFTYALVQADP